MAIDVYLQIEGIKGESSDDKHKDWIECTSAVWSILQPRSATASTGGGHTAERCEHGDLVITKLADLSSPVLLQTCSAGKTIPKAKLEFMRADGQGGRTRSRRSAAGRAVMWQVAGICRPTASADFLFAREAAGIFSALKHKARGRDTDSHPTASDSQPTAFGSHLPHPAEQSSRYFIVIADKSSGVWAARPMKTTDAIS